MNEDCKSRMTLWCLLAAVGILLVVAMGAMLFFEPGHSGGPLDKSDQSRPAQSKGSQ